MEAPTTPPDDRFTPELVERLTCPKEYNLKGMIRELGPLPPALATSTEQHRPASPISPPPSPPCLSSLGDLECLPVELWHMVLEFLDAQALVRLAQTSHAARLAVDALPVYCEVRKHMPDVLVALSRTRMLRHHAVAQLRAVLRDSRCASCFGYGGFLLLPTCERVCFDCLHENRALRMTTLGNVRECFRLTTKQMETRLPVFYTIPGSYGVRWHKHYPNVHRLINVRQAKALAITMHGEEQTKKLLAPTKPGNMSIRKYHIFQGFHEASLTPPGKDLTLLPTPLNWVEDDFGGVASMRMPYLDARGRMHRGRCCRGCRRMKRMFSDGQLPDDTVSGLVPDGVDPNAVLDALVTRLYSDDSFIDHVRDCFGVQQLLSFWDEGHEDEYQSD
ncbi:hypothetical protein SEUCBS139899_004290 [Sporothrix eucalyptigena]|uniref:F-box domain-containing protein n=1 Tax=Sporothrix eucalyptigena TaxID=1812306 RepID=A0ABP0BU59_9PEZI